MTNGELGSLALALMLVIGMANLMGHLFLRMHQPKIVGEILAGILIGPMVLGHLNVSVADLFGANGSKSAAVLECFYNLGLLLLMFVSGAAARRVLARENRSPTAWLLACGTTLPFLLVTLAFTACHSYPSSGYSLGRSPVHFRVNCYHPWP